MNLNYALAKEIYGLTPWLVDAHSLPGLLGVLNNVNSLGIPETKLNSTFVYNPVNDTKIIHHEWELMRSNVDFDAVAFISLDGPITLNGGESSVGMAQLSDKMMRLNNDSRIKAFIIYANSGGGASGAVKIMSDTINTIKESKPVYGLIQKGGMAASACFGILSACDKIYSEDEMNIVGSAGTMIEFAGRKANSEDKDGVKYVRLYAPKSKRKNEGFEEALNNDNYEILVDDLLKPVNESFLALIESNRPILKGTDFDDGHTRFSKDAIGTFIDGIKSFEDIVSEILSDEKVITLNDSTLNNLNNSNMTKAELKSQHPELYASIHTEGVNAEFDRVGAWMAHLNTDSEAVITGIDSGESITSKQTQELIVKQASQTQLKNLAGDSPGSVITEESSKGDAAASTELDAFYKGLDSKLNLKKQS